jgi:hypothetical protein
VAVRAVAGPRLRGSGALVAGRGEGLRLRLREHVDGPKLRGQHGGLGQCLRCGLRGHTNTHGHAGRWFDAQPWERGSCHAQATCG